MFQRILAPILLLAVAVGCSHKPSDDYSASSGNPAFVPAAPIGPKEVLLGPGDRNPAGEPRLYWKDSSKSYEVRAGGAQVSDDFVIQQIMEWETRIPVVRHRMVPGLVTENDALCEGYQCNGGGGQSAAWNAFFSAPKEQKAARLNDAIKGIGDATAKNLLRANFFHSKPRSWQAFVDEIDRALSSSVITAENRYEIVVKYRYDNMITLGYNTTDCQPYTYRCQKVYMGLVDEAYQDVEIRRESRVENQKVRKINFTVRDPKLQSFETEVISLTVGEAGPDIQVRSSGYTKYSAPRISNNGNDANVEIVGEERIPVDLPSEAYVGNDFKVMNQKPVLTVKVNPKYVSTTQADGLQVSYFVQTCKLSRWLPGCGTNSWVNGDMKYVSLRSAETAIEVPIEHGYKSQVKFRILRKNSIWYNDKPLYEVETAEITQ